jgi:hypothetical protein
MTTALKNRVINQQQVQALLVQREALDAIKKRYELLENSVRATEQDIIRQLEAGARAQCGHELSIRTVERGSG